ncbi:MAG: transporter associated domain-containing protein [Alphaproteobacteria bacterium]
MTDEHSHPTPNDKRPLFLRLKQRLRDLVFSDTEQAWHELREQQDDENRDLTEHEKHLVSAALRFDTITADEVAVSRSDVVAIQLKNSFKEVLAAFQTSRKSRLLVVGDGLDDVRGLLSNKDVLACVGKEKEFDLAHLMRPATFIPGTMALDKALQHLRKNKTQVAVVVDEYGGTAGLLSVRDVLEELVGDLADEDSRADVHAPIALSDAGYRVDPLMPLADFYGYFKLEVPKAEVPYSTVAGMLMHLCGRIPPKGEKVTAPQGFVFVVTNTDMRRILGVDVQVPEALRKAA